MAEKVIFDGLSKTITVKPGVTEIDVQKDLYMAWMDWVRLENNAQWVRAFRASGREPTNESATQFTPSYYFLLNGWAIVGNTGENISIQTNLYPDPDGTTTTASMFVTSNDTNIFNRQSDAPVVASDLEKALAYGGVIYIDTNATESGQAHPYGTTAKPVNNLVDAQAISNLYGIDKYYLNGHVIVENATGYVFDNFEIQGGAGAKITSDGTAAFINGIVTNIILEGDFGLTSRDLEFIYCHAEDGIENISGQWYNSGFKGSFKIRENTDMLMLDCYSEIGGSGSPTMIMPDNALSANNISFRGYKGGLLVQGFKGPDMRATLAFASGKCTVDNTNTDGEISLRGIPFSAFTDQSAGTSIDTESLLASQATLSEALENLDYGGQITINTETGSAGTDYPVGTHAQPVNNLADALTIANNRHIFKLHLHSNLVIDQPINGFRIEGVNGGEMVTIQGVDVRGTYFYNVVIGGAIVSDGQIRVENCQILPGTTGLSGAFKTCGIMGDITVVNPAVSAMIDCFTVKMSPLDPDPTIFFEESDDEYYGNWSFVGFANGVKLANLNHASSFIEFNSRGSKIEILPSNTAGTIRITGVSDNSVVDNSEGATIDINTLSASATKLNDTLEKIDYNDEIHINTNSGFTGTSYPVGTAKYPVNNLTDAKEIAEANNIYMFHVHSDLTISLNMSGGYVFEGHTGGELLTFIGANLSQAYFKNFYVTGDLGGYLARFEKCRMSGVTNFVGSLWECIIFDDIEVTEGNEFLFRNCHTASYSAINEDTSTPVLRLGTIADGKTIVGNIRGWHGPLQIANMDNALKSLTLHADSGYVIIDSSNTDGFLYMQGIKYNSVIDQRPAGSNLFVNLEELKDSTDDESREKSKADLGVLM